MTAPDPHVLAEAEHVVRDMANGGLRREDGEVMAALEALLAEYERRGAIEQRARLVAEGRPARPDRHVANALSVTGGPSPWQSSVTAEWIVNGPEVSS